jgi:hypothetical protein
MHAAQMQGNRFTNQTLYFPVRFANRDQTGRSGT